MELKASFPVALRRIAELAAAPRARSSVQYVAR